MSDLRSDLIALRRDLCERGHRYWSIADTATNCSDEHRAMHRHMADAYKDCYHKLGQILGISWQDEQFTPGWEAGRPEGEP